MKFSSMIIMSNNYYKKLQITGENSTKSPAVHYFSPASDLLFNNAEAYEAFYDKKILYKSKNKYIKKKIRAKEIGDEKSKDTVKNAVISLHQSQTSQILSADSRRRPRCCRRPAAVLSYKQSVEK